MSSVSQLSNYALQLGLLFTFHGLFLNGLTKQECICEIYETMKTVSQIRPLFE